MKKFLLLLVTLLIAGCSQVTAFHNKVETDMESFISKLQNVTIEDVDQAYKLAEQTNDEQGMFCWKTVKEVVSGTNLKPAEGEHLASFIQRVRNESRGNGPLTKIKEACDPVFKSVPDAAVSAAAKLGLKFAPVPIPKP